MIPTLCAEHGSLDGGQDLELRSNGGDAFANLQQVLKQTIPVRQI